jgi:hypothetical protein
MMPRNLSVMFVSACVLFLASCSSDSKKTTGDTRPDSEDMKPFCELPDSCKEIAQACMPKDDVSSAEVHECHMIGMGEGNEADCTSKKASCLATCNAAPALSDDPPEDLNAACVDGGSGSGNTVFPDSALLTFEDGDGALDFEFRTAPDQPIHVGPDGMGKLTVHDATTGSAVDGLDIAVATYMPVMGHTCSPVAVKVTAEGNGEYMLSPFLASMKGDCELKLTISGAKSLKVTSPTFTVVE